jgi:hypothetical protein
MDNPKWHKWQSGIDEVRADPSIYVQDMEKLFSSGKFCDVKIVCGNETFPCHKYILASRSDVFAAMFDMTSSTENQKGFVQVDDFDAKTMKTLLSFIYGNKIDRKDGDIDLLLAADKYNIPGLVECCEDSILSKLSLDNALETLVSSRLISSKKIFNAAKEVIQEKGAADIEANEIWNKLKVDDPKLAIELLEDCIATRPIKASDKWSKEGQAYDSDDNDDDDEDEFGGGQEWVPPPVADDGGWVEDVEVIPVIQFPVIQFD